VTDHQPFENQTSLAQRLRRAVAATPVLGPVARRVARGLAPSRRDFVSSTAYWTDRYDEGGNSGAGSYGRLAEFKAATLNAFVAEHGVTSVLELGCGDGAQLALARYPSYTGLDISPRAVEFCRARFAGDASKRFLLSASAEGKAATADLALSLDVIYHLVEDAIHDAYMRHLVDAAERYIAIYSSNEEGPGPAEHVRHRRFTGWIAENAPEWTLIGHVPNAFPYSAETPNDTSWADFYFFRKQNV
jgi:SAM-dependent methyltransferase